MTPHEHACTHGHTHTHREKKMVTEGLREGKNRQEPAGLTEFKAVKAGSGPDHKSQTLSPECKY